MREFSIEESHAVIETVRERARNEILAFTLYTKPDYQINWHHKLLGEKLDAFVRGDIRFLMVFMPPRHGKSELVSRRLPAMLHGKFPDSEIMACSYLDSLAGDMTIAVQNVIDSKAYHEIFPETKIWAPGTSYTKGTRNSSEHHIIGRRGKYRGQGVGGSFTGKGANFIIIDDPIKGREIADSIAFRERLWNFYNNDLFTRLETDLKNGRLGQVLITQTRWHEDDLSGRLIDLMHKDPNAVQWDILSLPAIRVDKDNKYDPRELGQPLWPKKYNLDQLNQIKAALAAEGGVRGWSSLFQQNPIPDGGGLFKDRMFAFCDLPGGYDYTFVTGDTAYEEKQENDFHCFTAWGVKGDQPYILDVIMEQIKAVDAEAWAEPFIRKYSKWGSHGAYIEPKGHGIYLNQAFRRKPGILIPSENDIKDFYSDRNKDKVARANAAVPHLANRKIYISNHIANKETLVAQCLSFPKTKHDDFVDTVVDGLKKIYGRSVSLLDLFARG